MATALVVVVFAGCGGCGAPSTPSTPQPMPSGPWYCTFIRCTDGGIVTPGPRCSAATCTGCCDVNGRCQAGSLDFACGAQGSACTNCTGRGVQCVFGTCVVLDEPARCSAASCSGCCTAEGFCNPGTADTSCGPRGTTCTTCDPGFGCERQQCVRRCGASNCSGCCDQNAVCLQGLSDSACGRGGDACQRCESSMCRSSGRCVARPTCSTCTEGQCCLNGFCAGTTADLCATTGVPNAECRFCPAPAACGGGTERGFCVNAGTRPLGAPCLWDGECAAGTGSGRPTCLTGLAWPGGYCSDTCTATTCLAPDLCWTFQSQSICLKGCSTPGASCGDAGTVCDIVGSSTSSACVPKCTPASAGAQCASGRCHGDGRCCGSSDKTCCDTGAACAGPAADGGVSACLPNGRCS